MGLRKPDVPPTPTALFAYPAGDWRPLWACLSQLPEPPTSCQRIRTIFIPLTQEEFNEAGRRRGKSHFSELLRVYCWSGISHSWSHGALPRAAQALAPKGLPRTEELKGYCMPTNDTPDLSPCHPPNSQPPRKTCTMTPTSQMRRIRPRSHTTFWRAPHPSDKMRDRKLSGAGGETRKGPRSRRAGRGWHKMSQRKAQYGEGFQVEVALSRALKDRRDRGRSRRAPRPRQAESPVSRGKEARRHLPGWAGRSMARAAERGQDPLGRGRSRGLLPVSPGLGPPQTGELLRAGRASSGLGLGTHRARNQEVAGGRALGGAQAGRRPTFQLGRVCQASLLGPHESGDRSHPSSP